MMMMVIRIYMHLRHIILVMKKFLVYILVIACNRPIGFKIREKSFIWHLRFQILFKIHYKIRINTLKLRTDITSRLSKKVKYERKCVTITEILSSQCYTTYFWHWIHAIGYFKLLRLWIWGVLVYSTKGFARCTLEQNRKMWLHYHIVHRGNMHFWGK